MTADQRVAEPVAASGVPWLTEHLIALSGQAVESPVEDHDRTGVARVVLARNTDREVGVRVAVEPPTRQRRAELIARLRRTRQVWIVLGPELVALRDQP